MKGHGAAQSATLTPSLSDILYRVVIRMFRRIRDLREDCDLTQKQMAEILHCSQQVYSNYELGQRDIPTNILIELSKFHHVSVDYILELKDEKN